MNILIVHEVSYSKKVVYEYQEFAEMLASRGHSVTVIDFDDRADGQYFESAISRTGLGEITLRRTPHMNWPIIKYLSGRASFPRLLNAAIAEGRAEIVFLYSVFINGTETVRICGRRGIPVVYRLIDAYHKLRSNPWIEWPLLMGERFIYRNADVICLLNRELEPYVRSVAGAVKGTLQLIGPAVDTRRFKRSERDPALASQAKLGPDDRVALFLGTLYPFVGLDRLLEEWEGVMHSCDGAKLVIVGDGPFREPLEALVRNRSLEGGVVFVGARPFDEVPGWISLADVAINPFVINDITRDIIPIKMLQYLACESGVVSSPIPGLLRLLPEEESGVVYHDIKDHAGFAKAILGLLMNKSIAEQRGKLGRRLVVEKFSLEATVTELEQLLLATCEAEPTLSEVGW